jgi:hypothetical protein
MQAEKFYYYQNLLTEPCKNPQGSVEHTLEKAVQCGMYYDVRRVTRLEYETCYMAVSSEGTNPQSLSDWQ